MNVGQFSIFISFFAALGATVAYYRQGAQQLGQRRGKEEKPPASARRFYWAMTIAGLVASVVLFYGFLAHQFQYSYVARYSSRSLPLMYLISAFWAGQEGTFLLWAVLVNIMGVVFSRRLRNEGYAMAVVSGFSAFLYLLLIVKSPFAMLMPVPLDGSGLNPLLQDPWMAIHPPILFVGYAATVFPFALVVSALIRRNYEHWFASGFAWTLFASLALGAGIIIGGFWAYEVLGWGGYWGWDPVENSSLVPWLVLLALTHGLLVQRQKRSLIRTNIFLAVLSFLLVLYATFLTRSGVLADFSVHSFVDLGINNYLIAMMVLSAVVGFGLFARRFKEIRSQAIDTSSFNREVVVLLSIVALLTAALFTFVGMSSPILTGLFGKPSQVDTPFYNKVNLPVAIVMGLLLGIAPFLGWTEEKKPGLLKRLSLPLMLTGLSIVIAYVAGVDTAVLLMFVAMAVFGLVSNVIIAFRTYRSGWMTLGGPVAHIGVGLLLLGIIGSGSFDESTQLLLQPGIPQSAYGHQFVFRGSIQRPNQKDEMNIEVSDGRTTRLATPKLYYSQYNRAMMREPDIMILPLKDLYLSPLELRSTEAEHHHPMLELTKGETKEFEGYSVTFVRFDVEQHGETGGMAVGAVLDVKFHEKNHEIIPYLSFTEQGERKLQPADLPAFQNPTKGVAKPSVTLNGVNVDAKKVLLEFHGFNDHSQVSTSQALLLEVSTKPLMMVVWTGVVLIIGGTAIAFRRRITNNGFTK
jgi:cytochrome c-type biogenesis protein CcmF